jgi:cardiolipin synthase
MLNYLLVIGTGLIVFVAVSHILYQKKSAYSMISWLLAVVLVPHIAVPLYFLVGTRKRSSRWHKSAVVFDTYPDTRHIAPAEKPYLQIFSKNGIPPATRHNNYHLITSGQDAFDLLIHEIGDAQQSIYISTYVFADDVTTRSIISALAEKSRQGIEVRLLLDLVGSFAVYLKKNIFQDLVDAGGEVLFFTPLFRKPFQSYVNLRNHRKIYLFDRKILLSGGMNLSNEYMGADNDPDRWQDILYRLEGESVYNFYTLFVNDWNYAASVDIPLLPPPPKSTKAGYHTVQFVPSGPDIPGDALYEALLSCIFDAKERIWIVTPYFVPDDTLMQALLVAVHRDIDVKLITPKRSNHILADLGRSSYMRELSNAGGDVLLYTGDMLHAKAILIDSENSMVGSVNFDNRSLFLNYEVVTCVYSADLIEDIEAWIVSLIDYTVKKRKETSKPREALENMMKVFAPLL